MFTSIIADIEPILRLIWQDVLAHLLSPNKRLYWGYLLSTLFLIMLVFTLDYRRNGQWNWRKAFGRDILLHSSSRLDSKIWFINLFIKAWVITPLLFSVAPIAIFVHNSLNNIFGVVTFTPPEDWVVLTSFTLFLFLLDDFTRFLLHWLMHKVPLLWRFHQVHHSAEVMTPLTVYRTHPLESFLYAARLLLVNAITIGIGVYLFKAKLSFYDIAGANVGVFLFNLLGSNLRHSHVWLSWGKQLENWLISPAQHQIHHSLAQEHWDKNYGTALAIWDRIWGTLVKGSEVKDELRFGINDKKINTLNDAYFGPFRRSKQKP